MKQSIRSLVGSGLAGAAILAAGLAGGVAHAQDKAPIKAATLLDFTRVYTFLTDEYSQGQQDYVKLLNMEGGVNGHPVELIVRDQGSQPQQGIALYNQARQEGAIFFDFLSTPVANAVMPRANEDHLPMMTFAHGRADAIDGQRFPFVFPSAAIYRSQAALLLQYMDENGGLKDKKIAFVHIDSPFGREPIALLEAMAEKKGFTLQTFPYAVPGTEQSAAWTDVRRFRPDNVIIWGAGPGQAVSIRGAISNGISPKSIYSVIWLSETDMRSFQGDAVVGVKRFTAVSTGIDSAILKRINEKIVAAGQGTGDAKVVGSTYYNIGVASMAIMAHAAQQALDKLGAPLTGDKLKAGFEMIKDFDAEGLMPPLTITGEDHQGGGWGRVSEWDGDKWVPLSDWGHAYQDVVWQLVRDDAEKAAKEAKK